jgi:hypothetical protein
VIRAIGRKQTGKGKHFFFEKKKQKTFVLSPLPQIRDPGDDTSEVKLKVFWFFFSKKNCFLPSPACPAVLRHPVRPLPQHGWLQKLRRHKRSRGGGIVTAIWSSLECRSRIRAHISVQSGGRKVAKSVAKSFPGGCGFRFSH